MIYQMSISKLSFVSDILMTYLLVLLILALTHTTASFSIHSTADSCRFAKNYQASDLLADPQLLDDFLRNFIHWEAQFMKNIGVDSKTGFTYDGIRVDVTTGQPISSTLHTFTASSKESIHLAIMAKVLERSKFSEEIYTPTEVFRLIQKKTDTLEQFYSTYPGFAGFMPWVTISESGLAPAHDFKSRVPALDNGEMFWAALALSRVWEKKYPNILPQLRARFDQVFWKGMIRNARKVFFNQTTGKIRAVADIANVYVGVEKNNYTNNDAYYLDDPYEGELFTWIVTLLAANHYFSDQEIDAIWADKRVKLQSVDYTVRSKENRKVTVEKGWWYSSHEQWKLLFLPYRASPIFKRIQFNNERARTWHSVDLKLPGMYGCQAGPASNNTEDTGYYCSGISEIAFQQVKFDKLVTPYACFPLLLLNKEIGTAWLHNSIYSPCGQTKYGALEGTGLNGTLMSPVLTWDTKITAALAVMNGTWEIIMEFLDEKELLEKFAVRIQNEYRLAFNTISGEDLPLPLPSKLITEGRPDFTSCR